jgi:hypothetical protein
VRVGRGGTQLLHRQMYRGMYALNVNAVITAPADRVSVTHSRRVEGIIHEHCIHEPEIIRILSPERRMIAGPPTILMSSLHVKPD